MTDSTASEILRIINLLNTQMSLLAYRLKGQDIHINFPEISECKVLLKSLEEQANSLNSLAPPSQEEKAIEKKKGKKQGEPAASESLETENNDNPDNI